MVVKRYEIYIVSLDPTMGSEIRKTRPCMVISPDEINRHLRTVIVAPMTTAIRTYPTRVNIFFRGKEGQVALDQLRSVDKLRLVKKLGNADLKTCTEVRSVLMEMVQ